MKKQSNKKTWASLLLLLLTLVMVATTLASCNGDTEPPTADTSAPSGDVGEADTGDTYDYPYSKDYSIDGSPREFRVMQRTGFKYEFATAEQGFDGTTINDAVYSRNCDVEERYNIVITTMDYVHTWQDKTFANILSVMMDAGEDTYDLIAGYQSYVLPTIPNGWYLDWRSEIPNMDFDAPFWDNGITDSATINGKSFAITGDLAITYMKHMSAMTFNKKMVEAVTNDNLYQVVFDGKWTFEYMKQLAAKGSQDTDGNGMDKASGLDTADIFGFASDWDVAIDCFKDAFECPTVVKSVSGNFILNVGSEKMIDIVEALQEFYKEDYAFAYKGIDPRKLFQRDKAMLAIMRFEMIEELRLQNYAGEYGIIPYPKWDEEQREYYSGVVDGVTMFFVPKTVPDTEFVGTVTMAMAQINYESVIPEYYTLVLKGRVAQDEESYRMLDLIRESATEDFGQMFSSSLSSVGHMFRESAGSTIIPTTTPDGVSIVTLWEKNEAVVIEKIKEMLAFYED